MSEAPPPLDPPVVVAPPRPEEAPDAALDGREQRLDPRVVAYWLVSGMFGTATIIALVALGCWYLGERVPAAAATSRTIALSVGGVLLAWTLLAPPLAYQRWRFSVDAELLRMRSGILFHEEKAIPISRLQHVDLLRGPIERLFGLATLVIWTAGNEGAAFRVQGLEAARAARLRDAILAARGDDVV